MKAFPGQMVYFLDFTPRRQQACCSGRGSDRKPGNYYLLDRANGNKIVQIGSTHARGSNGKQMAPMTPIEFTTRDGAKLYGFYTAPIGAAPARSRWS